MSGRWLFPLLVLALLAGCSAPGTSWNLLSKSEERSHATQSDVNELNDAISAASNLHYDDAIKKLAPLLKVFENSGDRPHAAECMFWLAFCYEKTAHKAEAVVFYQQILRKYPKTRAAEQAQERLARLEASKNAS